MDVVKNESVVETPQSSVTSEEKNKGLLSSMQKICGVCGDKALGYNFNAVSCESCKAFFRRNALTGKEFKCPFTGNCEITVITRRFCQKCRLEKCFQIGMVKEFIMSEKDKAEKKKKIEANRAKKRPLVADEVSSSKHFKSDDQDSSQCSSNEHSREAPANIQYDVLNSTTCSPSQSFHSPIPSQSIEGQSYYTKEFTQYSDYSRKNIDMVEVENAYTSDTIYEEKAEVNMKSALSHREGVLTQPEAGGESESVPEEAPTSSSYSTTHSKARDVLEDVERSRPCTIFKSKNNVVCPICSQDLMVRLQRITNITGKTLVKILNNGKKSCQSLKIDQSKMLKVHMKCKMKYAQKYLDKSSNDDKTDEDINDGNSKLDNNCINVENFVSVENNIVLYKEDLENKKAQHNSHHQYSSNTNLDISIMPGDSTKLLRDVKKPARITVQNIIVYNVLSNNVLEVETVPFNNLHTISTLHSKHLPTSDSTNALSPINNQQKGYKEQGVLITQIDPNYVAGLEDQITSGLTDIKSKKQIKCKKDLSATKDCRANEPVEAPPCLFCVKKLVRGELNKLPMESTSPESKEFMLRLWDTAKKRKDKSNAEVLERLHEALVQQRRVGYHARCLRRYLGRGRRGRPCSAQVSQSVEQLAAHLESQRPRALFPLKQLRGYLKTRGLHLPADRTLLGRLQQRYGAHNVRMTETWLRIHYPTEQTEQTGQTGQTEQTAQTEQTGQTGQTEQTAQTEQTGQTEQTAQTEQTGQTEQTAQTEQTGQDVPDATSSVRC